jgi:drug/metabolite transporter (DMT)-like permease
MKKKLSPIIVFLSSLLWATDAPFRKPLLVAGLGTGFVAFLEHGLNTLVSLPGLIKNRGQFFLLTKKQWAGLFYIGAGASALGALLFVKGAVAMNYNFTVAALLQKIQPIFAIILAVIFLKEKLNSRFWLWSIPAVVGAYLVSFGLISPINFLKSAGQLNILGPLLAIGAAMLWAGGTVVGKSLMQNLNLQFVNSMRFIFGFVFLCFYVIFFEKMQFAQMTPGFWLNTFIIAMLTGFFALLFYYFGLKDTKASVATLMELGYPLALAFINWKFLGIVLTPWQLVGTAILLISVTGLVLDTDTNTQS